MQPTPELVSRAAKIKLLLCDVDGVMTDGGVFIAQGLEIKRYFIRDGLGLRLASKQGIKIGWISNRASTSTAERARELKVDYLYQASGSKVAAAEEMRQQAGAAWEEICFMGDDIVDIGLFGKVGLGIAVADATTEARLAAHAITENKGGNGAVREVVEFLLRSQGKWQQVLAEHAAGKPADESSHLKT